MIVLTEAVDGWPPGTRAALLSMEDNDSYYIAEIAGAQEVVPITDVGAAKVIDTFADGTALVQHFEPAVIYVRRDQFNIAPHERDSSDNQDRSSCPLCDGSEDERTAAAEAMAAHLEPIIQHAERQREFGDVIIPAGLSREERRAFLTAHPEGSLVTDQMSDAEFADWLNDDDFSTDHATIHAPSDPDRCMKMLTRK
ncbi:hypothetical protein [Sphingobium yanoikuyae]|uniref:hypothetical protein n=1 Tax=Sphingobium yanoikuyae TaxID=13690 RepID=UPI0035C7B8FB